jgi:hypothetical protein
MAGIGSFEDGQTAETFINGSKVGTGPPKLMPRMGPCHRRIVGTPAWVSGGDHPARFGEVGWFGWPISDALEQGDLWGMSLVLFCALSISARV